MSLISSGWINILNQKSKEYLKQYQLSKQLIYLAISLKCLNNLIHILSYNSGFFDENQLILIQMIPELNCFQEILSEILHSPEYILADLVKYTNERQRQYVIECSKKKRNKKELLSVNVSNAESATDGTDPVVNLISDDSSLTTAVDVDAGQSQPSSVPWMTLDVLKLLLEAATNLCGLLLPADGDAEKEEAEEDSEGDDGAAAIGHLQSSGQHSDGPATDSPPLAKLLPQAVWQSLESAIALCGGALLAPCTALLDFLTLSGPTVAAAETGQQEAFTVVGPGTAVCCELLKDAAHVCALLLGPSSAKPDPLLTQQLLPLLLRICSVQFGFLLSMHTPDGGTAATSLLSADVDRSGVVEAVEAAAEHAADALAACFNCPQLRRLDSWSKGRLRQLTEALCRGLRCGGEAEGTCLAILEQLASSLFDDNLLVKLPAVSTDDDSISLEDVTVFNELLSQQLLLQLQYPPTTSEQLMRLCGTLTVLLDLHSCDHPAVLKVCCLSLLDAMTAAAAACDIALRSSLDGINREEKKQVKETLTNVKQFLVYKRPFLTADAGAARSRC